VLVAVQDQIRAVTRNTAAELCRVEQSPARPADAIRRAVVGEQDPATMVFVQALEQAIEACQLAGTEAAGREAGRGWRRGRQADDSERSAAAQEGEVGAIR
jgi:hypothetical protein